MVLRLFLKNLDLYQLLRVPVDEIEIDFEEFKVEFNIIKEKIIDLFSDKGAKTEKFSINSVEDCFQKISFSAKQK